MTTRKEMNEELVRGLPIPHPLQVLVVAPLDLFIQNIPHHKILVELDDIQDGDALLGRAD